MLNIKQIILIILISSTFIGLNACNKLPLQKSKTNHQQQNCDENSTNYYVNVEQYGKAEMLSYNIDITTSNVISKTNLIRNKLAEIQGGEIESFSSNEDNANIRMYYPLKASTQIDQVLSKDTEITSFNRSSSNIGQSYVDYAQRYNSYKILLDNFDEIKEISIAQSCDTVDTNVLKKVLQENIQNYKSNMTSYEKQMDKIYLQIYIRKST